jgi:FixJ family two-component response regulator
MALATRVITLARVRKNTSAYVRCSQQRARSKRQETCVPKVQMISIVDDDQSVRKAISALVRSLGYAAATFASAEDFLESGRVADTSCLITDVQMPGLSGVGLQSRLIADGRPMPIIGITANPEESIRAQMLEAGAVGFLNKPFHDESLIDCLTRALKSNNN